MPKTFAWIFLLSTLKTEAKIIQFKFQFLEESDNTSSYKTKAKYTFLVHCKSTFFYINIIIVFKSRLELKH
ncbi:MAG TPA: hypothetical protein DGQ38_19995 [Zunongwangia profunda]|uniref:Uncharacterized protein n=1 Tax=Zunongwangia profunda TaxID=398743 RepID=A0A3D5J5F3_9FLAO|nr:hypothetical protein [Zunongwangia profunda]